MRAVSLSKLRERVRVQTDTETAGRPTDAQLNDFINSSISSLHAALSSGGASLLLTSTTITTAPGTSVYALPAELWQLRSVVWQYDADNAFNAYRFEDLERAQLSNLSWGGDFAYQLAGLASGAPQIEFLPVPDEVATIRIGYVPNPVELTLDADTIACLPGWDRWIVYDASVPVLVAEETDPSALMTLRDQVWSREIEPATRSRDSARKRAVVEVE